MMDEDMTTTDAAHTSSVDQVLNSTFLTFTPLEEGDFDLKGCIDSSYSSLKRLKKPKKKNLDGNNKRKYSSKNDRCSLQLQETENQRFDKDISKPVDKNSGASTNSKKNVDNGFLNSHEDCEKNSEQEVSAECALDLSSSKERSVLSCPPSTSRWEQTTMNDTEASPNDVAVVEESVGPQHEDGVNGFPFQAGSGETTSVVTLPLEDEGTPRQLAATDLPAASPIVVKYAPFCYCTGQFKPCAVCSPRTTTVATTTTRRNAVKKLENYTMLKCSLCTEEFVQLIDLQKHEKIHAAGRVYICSLCNKTFSTSSNLYKHIRSHTRPDGDKPYPCDMCDKMFSRPSHLQIHRRVHTGEKPFDCYICGRLFGAKAHLSKHIRIHTGERPFSCSVCQKGFNSSSDLRKHSRLHTGEKPFECSLCGKTFSTKVNLETHIRFHTGDRPYHCELCDKTFIISSQLIQHRRSHTGEKPYQCLLCEMRFASSSDRKRHMRVHSGEKPYKCRVCSKAFSQSSTMKRHEKAHVLTEAERQELFPPSESVSVRFVANEGSSEGPTPGLSSEHEV